MKLSLALAAAHMIALLCPIDVAAQANAGVGTLLGPSAAPSEPYPEIATLEAQLKEIAERPDAHVAATLIAEARQALKRARLLAHSHQSEAAERAQLIAIAALSAASHTIARHQAELELAAIGRRKAAAQRSAEAAQQALAHARDQRGSVDAGSP